jgi:hypothetical protein
VGFISSTVEGMEPDRSGAHWDYSLGIPSGHCMSTMPTTPGNI